MFGDNHRLRKQLRADGRPAQAEVLEAKRRRWSSGHGGGVDAAGFSTGSTKPVYTLKLRVSPPDEPAFDVEITDESLQIPQVGMTVDVLFDPKHHSKVVLDLDTMDAFAARRQGGAAQADSPAESSGAGPTDAGARVFSAGPKRVVFDSRNPAFSDAPAPDPIDRLQKLADLRDRGAITDAEFETEKAKILGDG